MNDQIRRFSPSRTINYYKWNRYTATAIYKWEAYDRKVISGTSYVVNSNISRSKTFPNSGEDDGSDYWYMNSSFPSILVDATNGGYFDFSNWKRTGKYAGSALMAEQGFNDGRRYYTTANYVNNYYTDKTSSVYEILTLDSVEYTPQAGRITYTARLYGIRDTYGKGDTLRTTYTSTNRNAFPDNGMDVNNLYWCVYVGVSGYQQGTYIGQVVSMDQNQYPTNGRHTDGYWYVKVA